jgi:DNA polymerase-3 subunit delta'
VGGQNFVRASPQLKPRRCPLISLSGDERRISRSLRLKTIIEESAKGRLYALPAKDPDDEGALPHPRETAALFGHAEAERALLDAYRGGRIPHAWLIGGEAGIGKATLAFRMARFVLAHPDPAAPAVQQAASLAVPADRPVARRIASQSHTDLLVLERIINEKTGKLFSVIRVEEVRRTVSFFGSTAGEGGWRIAIVDTVDELGNEGDNALLKVLEEPPSRSLLLLVTHSPGRVIPTIRSRCRTLMLRPLATEDVARAAANALGQDAGDADIRAAAEAADGSVARALMILEGPGLELRRRITELLDGLPQLDQRALHALGDKLGGTDAAPLTAFMDTVNSWLSGQLVSGPRNNRRMAQLAEAWDKINTAGRDTEVYNLDRKPFVFSVFGTLADAARR